MTSADVAIACCRTSGTAEPTDLYPDPDAPLLGVALEELGASSTLVSWDDPGVGWSAFGTVLISSTWDGVDRPGEYLAWIERVAAVSVLLNPAPIIEWALDKVHQRELAEAGIPLVPTQWVESDEEWTQPAGEFVIKPSISSGSRNTARYGGDHVEAARAHVRALREAGHVVMVQEYLAAIDIDGEVDLIFFDGVFSHAVRKAPGLLLGEGVVERPWERMAWTGLVAPSLVQLSVARQTMETISGRFGELPTYARVDLVSDDQGAPLVLEVELIDPYLSLDMEPEAARRLARAVVRGR
jgi:hypothetical protein